MNGYTMMCMALTGIGLIVLFLVLHHGPTGLMRAAGLWLVQQADDTESRWRKVRDGHEKWLRRLAAEER